MIAPLARSAALLATGITNGGGTGIPGGGGGGGGDGVTASMAVIGDDTIIPQTTAVIVRITLSGVRAVDSVFEIAVENPFVTPVPSLVTVTAGNLTTDFDLTMTEAGGVSPFEVSASGDVPVGNTVEAQYSG